MQLSDRDRKLLWGRAANRCSRCRCELVVDPTVGDRESIVGDEAHILPDSPKGPRGETTDRANINSYENAILLCKVDHKMVDDQPNTYTTEVLLRMKADHEAWVRSSLTEAERVDAEEVAAGVAEFRHAEDEKRHYMLSRFGPTDWCVHPNANGPELVLRCAVALPAPVQLGASTSRRRQVTRLRAEAREDLIVSALDAAELTRRVRGLRSEWHWAGDGGWRVLGGAGTPELTRLEFDFHWPQRRIRQPVGLTCSVLTGVAYDIGRTEERDSLVIAVDLSLNLLELNADRQPSQIAYRTGAAPAPSALALSELAWLLRILLPATDFVMSLADGVLQDAQRDGHIAMWLTLNGVELERVINLEHVERLRGGLMVARWGQYSPWPLSDASDAGPAERAFLAEFLESLLEKSDYRRFQRAVAEATGQSNDPQQHERCRGGVTHTKRRSSRAVAWDESN